MRTPRPQPHYTAVVNAPAIGWWAGRQAGMPIEWQRRLPKNRRRRDGNRQFPLLNRFERNRKRRDKHWNRNDLVLKRQILIWNRRFSVRNRKGWFLNRAGAIQNRVFIVRRLRHCLLPRSIPGQAALLPRCHRALWLQQAVLPAPTTPGDCVTVSS